MKSLKLFAAFAVTLAALACNKEQVPLDQEIDTLEPQSEITDQNEKTDVPEGYVRLTFSTPTETKTSIDKASGVISWTAGDRIKICWEGGSAVSDEVDIEEDVARFSVTVPESAEDLYAVYPSGITASVTDDVFSVDIPQSQTGRFADADIIVAKTTKTDLTYVFHHAVSLVRFVISEGNSRNITRAQFVDKANNSCLYGTLGITFSGSDIDEITEPTTEANDVIDITAVAEGDNWLAVPPTKILSGFGLRMGTTSTWLPGVVGENGYTFQEAGSRLGFASPMDSKINDGCWYIKEEATGTGDGKSWANAGGANMLQSLMGDYSSGNAKNLARAWRINGKTIKVAEGNYTAPGTNGFTARYVGENDVDITIEGGYTTSGTKSSSAQTVFGPKTGNDPYRAFFFYGDNVSVTLQDLYCSNHERTGSAGGGAIYSAGGASLEVIGCTFDSNSTQNNRGGGAVLVADSTNPVRFENCIISNNSSDLVGGAVVIDTEAESVFEGCTFTGNSAQTDNKCNGGAIYIKASSLITNCTFTNNWVANSSEAKNDHSNGGAIYVDNDVTTLSSCVFNSNVASDGGALYVNESATLHADKCKFIGNYTDGKRWYSSSTFNGREGSGVLAFKDPNKSTDTYSSVAFFNSCEFRDNYASSSGIYCSNVVYSYSQGATVGFNNCVFYDNTNTSKTEDSTKPGWGVYSRGTIIMTNSTMIENCSNAVLYCSGPSSVAYNNILINTSTSNSVGLRGTAAIPAVHDYNVVSAFNGPTQASNEVTATSLGNGTAYSYATHAAGKAAGVSTGMSYYFWDGTTPAFTQTTKADVISQISLTDFYTWLNGLGALDTDIRGVTRSTGYWPGSYQNN